MAKQAARKRTTTKRSSKRKKGLTGAQLLKRGKERLHVLEDIPGLDGETLYVKLSAHDILDFTEMSTQESEGEANLSDQAEQQNVLLSHVLVDENGDTILTADEADELSEVDWPMYTGLVEGVMAVISGKQKIGVGTLAKTVADAGVGAGVVPVPQVEDPAPLPDGESSPTS